MRAGDVIFVRGKGWLSDLIRSVDAGEFSHVAIAVSDTEIFEAQYYKKSNITSMHYTDYDIIPLNLTDKKLGKLYVTCQILENKWYDYIQDIGYLFRKLFGADVKWFDNPDDLICSEAISLVLYMLDIIDEPMREITPNELYRYLKGVITVK